MKDYLPNLYHCLCFLALPWMLLCPVALDDTLIVGAPISDVWNGWWSLWHGRDWLLGTGDLCRQDINFPTGGCVIPADWTGLFWMTPLSLVFSPSLTFNITLYFQVVWIGVGMYCCHRMWFAQEMESHSEKRAFWAGTVLQMSTVVLTGLHNGSTEVLSLGWVLMGIFGWGLVLQGSRWGWLLVIPVVATSWYGVLGWIFFAIAMWCCQRTVSWHQIRLGMLGVGASWGCFVWWVLSHTTGTGNMLRIKRLAEMQSVRRTIGAADPLTYLIPWQYDSPDFADISRFGEQFVHSSYLGWVILGTVLWHWRNHTQRWLLAVGLVGFLLSLGPVLVLQSEPVVLLEAYGIPLPYLLLERLPLFDHLTLLYRLSWVPMVVIISLATQKWSLKRGWLLWVGALVEMLFLSPVRELPRFSSIETIKPIEVLEQYPQGAVGLYPLAGGRPYMLMSQIQPHPLTMTLNYPANSASLSVLQTMRRLEKAADSEFRTVVAEIAKQRGIRYWIIGRDASLMPDEYVNGIEKAQLVFPHVLPCEASDTIIQNGGWTGVCIIQLW